MSPFKRQPGYCCICGKKDEYEPHDQRGFICSMECHREYDWRYALYVLGKEYYPSPAVSGGSPNE